VEREADEAETDEACTLSMGIFDPWVFYNYVYFGNK